MAGKGTRKYHGIPLYTVARLLLAGFDWASIVKITGFPRGAILRHAKRMSYKLPTNSEVIFNDDVHNRVVVADVAAQGFSQKMAIKLLKLSTPLVKRYWPSGVPVDNMDQVTIERVNLMLDAKEDDMLIREALSITWRQLENVKRARRKRAEAEKEDLRREA